MRLVQGKETFGGIYVDNHDDDDKRQKRLLILLFSYEIEL